MRQRGCQTTASSLHPVRFLHVVALRTVLRKTDGRVRYRPAHGTMRIVVRIRFVLPKALDLGFDDGRRLATLQRTERKRPVPLGF